MNKKLKVDFVIVRVYGLLVDNQKILVSDEIWNNRQFTKFPGGGLEAGEGTIDCLKREFREEMSLDIEVINHFYTTDFYLPSAFDATKQILSIYYMVSPINVFDLNKLNIKKKAFDFESFKQGASCLRWLDIGCLQPEINFTFEIDKIVGQMLKNKLGNKL